LILFIESKILKNVGVRPARHPAGGFIESRKTGLDESFDLEALDRSSPYVWL